MKFLLFKTESFCNNPLFFLCLVAIPSLSPCENIYAFRDSGRLEKKAPYETVNIQEYFQVFYPVQDNAVYFITVCADLPVNDNPNCVYKKGEPGHVFLILTKQSILTGEVVTRSFGFYPRVPVSCLVKRVRSKILENNNREYDASLKKELTAEEFLLVIEKSKKFAKKKYNLNKYNCYDYVLEIFNSLPGIEKLPITYVKFPFIFGRGGSPCSLYGDFKKLASGGSSLAALIRFGVYKSPPFCHPQNLIASFNYSL